KRSRTAMISLDLAAVLWSAATCRRFRQATCRRQIASRARQQTRAAIIGFALIIPSTATPQPFHFPTANQALLEPGHEDKFFAGTVGKPWTSGTFGCVRTDGWQLHEGLDIRCLQRDSRGEPTDP